MLLNIMNDHGLEQIILFPTRDENTLVLFSLLDQFQDIHFSDKLSDHIVSGFLRIFIPHIKKPRRKMYLYKNGEFESIRTDALRFAKENNFKGLSDARSVQKNLHSITWFVHDSADKHIASKISKSF